MNSSYDSLSTNIAAAPMSNLATLDYLHSQLSKSGNYLLYMTNSYALGETRVNSNPILDIFRNGPSISFIGGAGIAYILYGNDAHILLAGRVDGYRGYKRFKSTGSSYINNNIRQPK